MATVLLVRPASDRAAVELSDWAARLKHFPTFTKPPQITDLASASATRAAVDAGLSSNDLIIFFGHGTASRLRGSSVDLVDVANIGVAANKGIVAIACSSAEILGAAAIKYGVSAYLGFTAKLVWVTGDPDDRFRPALCAGAEALLAPNQMDDAFRFMFQELTNVADYYHSGDGRKKPNATLGYVCAFWDAHHLKLHGDGSYSILNR